MKEYINEMLQLQNNLLSLFKMNYPTVKHHNLLLDCPRIGELDVHGQEWLFKKHGNGLKFKRKNFYLNSLLICITIFQSRMYWMNGD